MAKRTAYLPLVRFNQIRNFLKLAKKDTQKFTMFYFQKLRKQDKVLIANLNNL